MPKRKLGPLQSLDRTSSGRGFKLRKYDHQDVTITSAAVRLPVYRPRDAELKTTESRVVAQSRASSLNEIDQLAIRLTWLSLPKRPRFEISKPIFPKFPRLPTEIRMTIWKFARPDPRVIKLFKSNKGGITNPNSTSNSSMIHFVRLGCSTDHLVSRIPVPNLLHICSESRAVALEWYQLRFQPTCTLGGTYFDTQRDYIYYGPEERKLLVNPDSVAPTDEWIEDTNRWAKDRHSIPNMVVYLNFRNSPSLIMKRFMEISVWCNQYADQVLWVFESELELGALVSDLKQHRLFRDVSRGHTEEESTIDTKVSFREWWLQIQSLEPWWKRFNPTRVQAVKESATANQMQRSGFKERLFLNKKINFAFRGNGELVLACG